MIWKVDVSAFIGPTRSMVRVNLFVSWNKMSRITCERLISLERSGLDYQIYFVTFKLDGGLVFIGFLGVDGDMHLV